MSMAAVTERKPGRPRGPGRINATVRFTPERYTALRDSADRSGRSVSEEVEARIEKSFSDQAEHEAVERAFEKLSNRFHQLEELMDKVIVKDRARTEKLQQQITELQQERLRDLRDGNALTERLFQRVVDLQKERLDEGRLAQIVEDAVTRAARP